jgi:hypothetical protein
MTKKCGSITMERSTPLPDGGKRFSTAAMTPDLCKLHLFYIYQLIEPASTKRPRYNWRILTWSILFNVTTIKNAMSPGGEFQFFQ